MTTDGMTAEERGGLKQCTVVMTRGCNLRCDFCFAKGAGYRVDDQLSYDELRHIVDFCGEAGVRYMFFTGGEPLTHPHMLDTLRYVNNRYPSMTSALATNGILLADEDLCERLVDSGLGYLDVSMKGSGEESWRKATGRNGFVAQLDAISNLSRLPLEFTCSMVITQDSVLHLCDAVQAAHDRGARQFSFTFFIDNAESKEKDCEYLAKHDPFALIEAFLSQIDRLNGITDDWWVEYSFPLCVYTERQLKLLEGRLAGPCQVHLQNAITVNTRMELLPCDMFVDSGLGRLESDVSSWRELGEWRGSAKYQAVMREIRRPPSTRCSSCAQLDRCFGGCPVLWKNYSFEALMSYKAQREAGRRQGKA